MSPLLGGPRFKEPGTLGRLADGLNLIEGKRAKVESPRSVRAA